MTGILGLFGTGKDLEENMATDIHVVNSHLHDFLKTFAFVYPHDNRKLDDLDVQKLSLLAQEYGWRAVTRGRVDAISNSTADSWFNVI